jgi:hypothetical protein
MRALKRRPFPMRSKWSVTICLAILGTSLLAIFLVTHFLRPPNFCLASLFWFVQRWKELCFSLLLSTAVILLFSCVVIFLRLHNYVKIDSTERVAASRMIYYLTVAVLSNVSPHALIPKDATC